MIEHSVQQGTAEWYALRMGIPTASEFDKIITPATQKLSASRHKYAIRLICETLLNWQADSLDHVKHVAAGKEHEPDAVAQLEFTTGIKTRACGFLTTDDKRFGASPDRLAAGITIECKCPTIPTQMEYLLLGHGDAYRAQVMGQLFVAEADKAIFYSFHERTPAYLIETGRDEAFIRKLRDALEQFSDELAALTEKAKSLGVFQAFAAIVTPAEKEYGSSDMQQDPRYGMKPPTMNDAELDAFLRGDDVGTGRFAG